MSQALKSKVDDLPRSPGVYLYRDAARRVIYVGKAKSLKDRVSSYFVPGLPVGEKTQVLVSQIADLEIVEVQSEFEALLLESELIKRYRPKFNIMMKDDKSYKYIVITREKVEGELLPVVGTARSKDLKGKKYYGPYPDGRTVNEVLRSLRKIIPFRDCSIGKFKKYRKLGSPCLYGHINLCSAPCVRKISGEEYQKNIKFIARLLSGDAPGFLKNLKLEMEKAAKAENFEMASAYKELWQKYVYVTQRFRMANNYLDNPNLVSDLRDQALASLQQALPELKVLPRRIECYDIANISGKSATGSMVVAEDGMLVSGQYRRFKIKLKDTPDDFAMVREVLTRRFKRQNGGWEYPDLIVVDGGKGQVSVALEVLQKYQLPIALVGLAKRQETLVFQQEGKLVELQLPRTHPGLKLLQALRDEAHRFSRRYHHLLRMRALEV